MPTKNIDDYGARPGHNDDTTPAVRAALADLHGTEGGRIVFPKGCYHFHPDRAAEQYLSMSNNDAGLKRIAFPLLGLQNIEIDGGGSEFVFHGNITPFAVLGCANVCLHSFTIDWARTFHSELEILDVQDVRENNFATVDFRIPEAYPYVIQNERLLFLSEDGELCPLANSLEFDPRRRETAFKVNDSYGLTTTQQTRELAPNIIRMTAQFGTLPTPGNVLVIVHTGRTCPAIAVADSKQIEISDVTIHHAGAMGVIAQRTEDIRLTRVRVTPAAHKGRLVSATADATHFVNCRGLIEMADCLFEGQMDDPTNVHGIYARISRVAGPRQIEVELVHGQQVGIDITQAGDTIEFVRQRDIMTYHQASVTHVERLNNQYSLLTVAENLPDAVTSGNGVASVGWTADVSIHGCTARSNRARGFLLSTPGRIVVEDNHFHTPGAAILIAGDVNYWFESGAVRDVSIRGNHFDNCNYGVWGHAAIEVRPEIEPEQRSGALYHRNITIDGNTFDAFNTLLLLAYCVDGLTVTNNIVRPSDKYPRPDASGEPFHVTDCANVTITGNTFASSTADAAVAL